MMLDDQLTMSRDQVLTANAVSTNIIDFGQNGRDIGIGEELYLAINVKAATGTTPTLQATLQTSNDPTFASGVVSQTVAPTLTSPVPGTFNPTATTGQQLFTLNPGMLKYARMSYTVGGTSPSITLDAAILHDPEAYRQYPAGYTIQ